MYAYPYFFDYEYNYESELNSYSSSVLKLCYLFLERMLLPRGEYHKRPLRKIPWYALSLPQNPA